MWRYSRVHCDCAGHRCVVLTYTGIAIAYFGELRIDTGNPHFFWGSLLVFGCALTYAGYLSGMGRVVPSVGASPDLHGHETDRPKQCGYRRERGSRLYDRAGAFFFRRALLYGAGHRDDARDRRRAAGRVEKQERSGRRWPGRESQNPIKIFRFFGRHTIFSYICTPKALLIVLRDNLLPGTLA